MAADFLLLFGVFASGYAAILAALGAGDEPGARWLFEGGIVCLAVGGVLWGIGI